MQTDPWNALIATVCDGDRNNVAARSWLSVAELQGVRETLDQQAEARLITAALAEPCAVCGAPSSDEVCDVNAMPGDVEVWVPVCDQHQDATDWRVIENVANAVGAL